MRLLPLHGPRWLLLLAVSFVLMGCELIPDAPTNDPRIRDISVTGAQQGVPPVVETLIVLPAIANKRVRGVSAEFRSLLPPVGGFITHDVAFESIGNNRWRGTLPALNLGDYEVKVVANLRESPAPGSELAPSIDSFISSTQSFTVRADNEECFNFAATPNVQAWESDGFQAVSDGTSIAGCPDSAVWINDRLTMPKGAGCMPAVQYRVDLVSPDLTDRPGWEDPEGVVTTTHWNIAGMTFQPIFSLRGGSAPAAAPVNGNGEFIFLPRTGTIDNPHDYRTKIQFLSGTVSAVRLRYFGPGETSGAEGQIRVNSVCPIVDRPASN
ncbi:MAG: hypothetical protein AAGJ86_04665 [Pseudomonadota bacterium]